MLLLVIEIFLFFVRLSIMKDDLYDLHWVISHFFNFPLCTLQSLPSLVLLLLSQCVSILKLILLEVVIEIGEQLLTILMEIVVVFLLFDAWKYCGEVGNSVFACIVLTNKRLSALYKFECLLLNFFFQNVDFLPELFDQF